MQLGEMTSAAAFDDSKFTCPFAHEPLGKHDKKNELHPPKTVNNATTLSGELRSESLNETTCSLTFQDGATTKTADGKYSAHHLIPGNETWPKSKNQLYKWVDKRAGHIKGDIGYNVNSARNGIDLPGNSAVSDWSTKRQKYQEAYAFAFMQEAKRQFHDRHPAYSDFVVNVLNKIAEKLQARVKAEKRPGCNKTHCQGASDKKPYPPPYGLLPRINSVATRLARYLTGAHKNWQAPVMTSRFSFMLAKSGTSQQQAKAALKKTQFKY